MPIGVFDSGLGGLTVLRALRASCPGQAFVYLADSANAPYGMRTEAEIVELTRAGVARLFAAGCRLVILACNTASAVALRPLQEWYVPADRRVLGVLVPMVEEVAGRDWEGGAGVGATWRRVLFFGTPATVRSGAFSREVGLRADGVELAEVGCPGLVEALEAGDSATTAKLARGFAEQGLARMPEPQAVVLGCTHYPLVEPAFRAALPEGAAILSQPGRAADRLCLYLERFGHLVPGGASAWLTTGEPEAVSAAAARLLGERLDFRPA